MWLATLTTTIVVVACSGRQLDVEEDFTEEVARICDAFCEMNVACHEPPVFDTEDECLELCLDHPYMYDDTECGAAHRADMDCVGATTTCAEYLDTLNVHADDYTCKAERQAIAPLDCGTSTEDP